MISRNVPSSWQALQIEVGRILEECGFQVEVEKQTQAARGSVELDVYAEETVRGRKYAIVCECKFWKSRIPQAVIHGFRTVVQDIGANIGYIISMEGFQSGALSASDLTNLKLVTWQEFQDVFEESWFEEFFTMQIHNRLSGLMTYAEYIVPAWFGKMSDEDKSTYFLLKEKYDSFAWLMQSLGPYSRRFGVEPVPPLPLRERHRETPDSGGIPDHILDETGYRELLESSLVYGEAALAEFRILRDKYKD
ncbi:restriction endonuclease [Pseudomonas lundensis]|uniref:restriction endonuclease n=1 Tax=Pseudomonas lundensis TaxID=86185 RepID=UPI0014733A69|nr:restriction endonuclease [Pseudomonas lundensis]NNA41496.1 restriction endonuclease [Pseudomonas lundensis]